MSQNIRPFSANRGKHITPFNFQAVRKLYSHAENWSRERYKLLSINLSHARKKGLILEPLLTLQAIFNSFIVTYFFLYSLQRIFININRKYIEIRFWNGIYVRRLNRLLRLCFNSLCLQLYCSNLTHRTDHVRHYEMCFAYNALVETLVRGAFGETPKDTIPWHDLNMVQQTSRRRLHVLYFYEDAPRTAA